MDRFLTSQTLSLLLLLTLGLTSTPTHVHNLSEIRSAIPQQWTSNICTEQLQSPSTLQPYLAIKNPIPRQPPTNILQRKTCNLYSQLHQTQTPVLPAVDYWKQMLQPELAFNAKQW